MEENVKIYTYSITLKSPDGKFIEDRDMEIELSEVQLELADRLGIKHDTYAKELLKARLNMEIELAEKGEQS